MMILTIGFHDLLYFKYEGNKHNIKFNLPYPTSDKANNRSATRSGFFLKD
jgi:hypothetical protein